MDQEKAILDQCNGRNVYLNKSYGALKVLKNQVEQYCMEERMKSDERVRKLREVPTSRGNLELKESKDMSTSTEKHSKKVPSSSTEKHSKIVPSTNTEKHSKMVPLTNTEKHSKKVPSTSTEKHSKMVPLTSTEKHSKKVPLTSTEKQSKKVPSKSNVRHGSTGSGSSELLKEKTTHASGSEILKSSNSKKNKTEKKEKDPVKSKAKHDTSALGSDERSKKVKDVPSTTGLSEHKSSHSRRVSSSSFKNPLETEPSKSKIRHESAERKISQGSKLHSDSEDRHEQSVAHPSRTVMGLKTNTVELKYKKSLPSSTALPSPTMDFVALEEERTLTEGMSKKEEQRTAKLKLFYGKGKTKTSKKSNEKVSDSSKISKKKHRGPDGNRGSVKLSELDWIGISKSAKGESKHECSPAQIRGGRDVDGSSITEGGQITKLTSHIEEVVPSANTLSDDVGSHFMSGRVRDSDTVQGNKSNLVKTFKSKPRTSDVHYSKYSKLSLKPTKKQFTSADQAGNKSATSPICKSQNSINPVDLTSELFGSDEEENTSSTGAKPPSPSVSISKKFRKMDDTSEDDISGEDCFIVDCLTSRTSKHFESGEKSPTWSSDEDEWSSMKASFESALNSYDSSKTKTSLAVCKNKTTPLFKGDLPSKERLSIESVLAKGPSLKLSRKINDNSSTKSLVKNSDSLKRDSESSRRSSAPLIEDPTSLRKKSISSRKHSVSSRNHSVSSVEEKIPVKSNESKKSGIKELNSTSTGATAMSRVPSSFSIEDNIPIRLSKSENKEMNRVSVSMGANKKSSVSSPVDRLAQPHSGPLISLSEIAQERKIKGKKKHEEGKPKEHKVPSNRANVTHQQVPGKTKVKVGIVKKKEPPPLTSEWYCCWWTAPS